MSFRTILRYLIDPHFEAAARMEELAVFCRESRVDEVMLFVAAEELSVGQASASFFRHPGEGRDLTVSTGRTGKIPAFAGMTI